MKDKLVGDDVAVCRTLDKVELALRRAATEWHSPAAYGLKMVADEIQKIKKDLYQ